MKTNRMTEKNLIAVNSPDSLQDLCTFYCMNNLNIVVSSLNSTTCDDAVSSFPMQLGNKLLHYYMRCGIPNEESQPYLDQLLQNNLLCNELTVTRRGLLTAENILELANNPVKCLKLAFFEDDTSDESEHAKQRLIENNLEHVTDLCLYQKCTAEAVTVKMFCLVCGNAYSNDDVHVDQDVTNYGDDFQGSDEEFTLFSKSRFKTCQTDNLDKVNKCGLAESRKQSGLGEFTSKKAFNLKSFAYQHIFCNENQSYNRQYKVNGLWHYFTDILNNCASIQTFSLVTIISNPIEGFLCQPDVGCLQNLQSLTLSVVYASVLASSESPKLPYTDQFFVNLPLLKHLRHLDISVGHARQDDPDEPGEMYLYTDGQVEQFIQAVKDMPQLQSLDIAGTNLHKIISHKHGQDSECSGHCMAGFEGRRFKYLGVFTAGEASRHKFIPADKVSGHVSEEQLLVALWSYQHNVCIMRDLLFYLAELWQDDDDEYIQFTRPLAFINGLLAYLGRFDDWDGNNVDCEKDISRVLVCLLTLLRDDTVTDALTVKQRRSVLEQLLVICYVINEEVGWTEHNNYTRNRILKQFMELIDELELEEIVVYSYKYEQYINVLLGIFRGGCSQKCKLRALQKLQSACHLSQEHKIIAGTNLPVVKTLVEHMLDYVVTHSWIDDILTNIWSIIWILTDEVPSNCELFIKHGGCQVAKACLEKYPEKHLHRIITGAVSNISENYELHHYLMTQDLVDLFRGMLVYEGKKDFDTSSHVVDFLVMLASTGPDNWVLESPSRETILAEVETIIRKWNIAMLKGIYYSSVGPMLRLIENDQCGTAQLLGAWEIGNLLRIQPQRYVKMFAAENGPSVVNHTLLQEDLRTDVRELLNAILIQYNIQYNIWIKQI